MATTATAGDGGRFEQVDLLSLFTPESRTDPYPLYRYLRQTAPVYESPADPGTFVLTRFADCEAVLRDTRWSSNPVHRPVAGGEEADFRTGLTDTGANVLLVLDPPDHTRLRKLVSTAFTPRRVEALRPRVQALVDEILDRAAETGELDVVHDLGFTVPVTVICELMGVPVADREQFGPWSSAATRLLDGVIPEDAAMAGVAGLVSIIGYFNDLYEERRRNPGDDLLSALVLAEEEGDRLSEAELRSMTVLLFVAGHETTTNLIGNGAKALLEHPDQLRRVVDDPSLVPSAVEELLRFDGPVHLTGRIAREDGLEVGGRTFAAGEQVVTLLAAANRDPDRFADPDTLDVGRNDSHHLAFSHGIHFCLGASLARLEGQIALGSLVQRFPAMSLLSDPVTYRDHFVLRGLDELRVAVDG
ncbi:MAG: cytochrome P450 [Acidimicrobiales bacterium]